jgi:hypothetical protein
MYQSVVYAHIAAGTVALVTFWLAAALRKGSERHIAVGRWFLSSMLAVMLTAAILSIAAFATDKPVTGTFLAYLVVITATACWNAWRAIRDKSDWSRFAGRVYRALAWTNLAAGLSVLVLGLRYSLPLFIGLSVVGLLVGATMLQFARRSPVDKRWWLAQHFSGIVGAGVATHVAFLGIGLTRALPAEYAGVSQTMMWVAPFAASIAARVWFRKKYATRPKPIASKSPVTVS